MERLSGSNTTTVSHLQATETESNSVTESIDHFAEQYSQPPSQNQNHANSDHTFHPISASEGLQVNNLNFGKTAEMLSFLVTEQDADMLRKFK